MMSPVLRYLAEVSRIVLSSVFILSGGMKAIDPVGVSIKIEEYLLSFGLSGIAEHTTLVSGLAYGLCAVEFLLGAFLLTGIYRRLSSRLIFLMMLVMTLLTGYVAFTNSVVDCGCFGDAITLSNRETFIKNLILLPLSWLVMRYARRLHHLYTRRERWIPTVFATLGIILFIHGNIKHLPVVDFRPYPRGLNLAHEMRQADSLYQARLLEGTRYIYELDGVRQSFSMDSLPEAPWQFVDVVQSEDLAEHKSPYTFDLLDADGANLTEEVLTDTTGSLLLLSPNLLRADQGAIDQINELYVQSRDKGYKFYGVSPAGTEAKEHWTYLTGTSYPFLVMDATTIKTIGRSNPTLLLLKDGRIVDKVAVADFPEVEDIPSYLISRMERGEMTQTMYWHTILLGAWGLLLLYGALRLLLRYVYIHRVR